MLLEGKKVNLRIVENEDLPLVAEWFNNLEFNGEYDPLDAQLSRVEVEKKYSELGPETRWFIIEKKDGSKIGFIGHFVVGKILEIGYSMMPDERRKGYCTEATRIMVDYLFLSKNTERIQAQTNVKNTPSQRVLEKTGFKKEGVVRKACFVRGEWSDFFQYSILRDEWKEPKILTKVFAEDA
jgi:RimJ/RimL family protein N-acetyltransferase